MNDLIYIQYIVEAASSTTGKVPKLDSFIVATTYNDVVIELQTCHAIRVVPQGHETFPRIQAPNFQGPVV